MAKSRYEKNVIRKPAVIKSDGSEATVDELKTKGQSDTGSLTWFSQTLVKGAQSIIELTIISGDIFVGRGSEWPPRKTVSGKDDKNAVIGRGPTGQPINMIMKRCLFFKERIRITH